MCALSLALAFAVLAQERPYFVDVAAAVSAPSIVAGTTARQVAWLDARDGTLRGRLDVEGAVWAVAIDPAGTLAAVLLRSGQVVLWPLAEGGKAESIHALAAPEDPKDAAGGYRFGAFCEFAPDGERLLVASAERGIVLLSRGGERVGAITGNQGSWFGPTVAWAPDGGRFAYASEQSIHVVDARSGEAARFAGEAGEVGAVARIEVPYEAYGLAFSPGGARLASGHRDGRIRVFDLADGAELARFEHVDPMFGPPPRDLVEDPFDTTVYVGELAYSPDGVRLAYTTGTGVYLGVFDLASGARVGLGPYCGGRMGEPAELRWAPDGGRVWYAFVSGVMDVHWLQLGAKPDYGMLPERGTAPVFGAAGRGFTCLSSGKLRAFDGVSLAAVWELEASSLNRPTTAAHEGR